jgi:hypothetical protein
MMIEPQALNDFLAKLNHQLHAQLLATGLVSVEKWNAEIAPYLKALASLAEGSPIHARSYRVHESIYPSDASEIQDKKLEKPAMVGNTRFGEGVSERLVIDRAQREYEYQVTPEKEAERIERGKEKGNYILDSHGN